MKKLILVLDEQDYDTIQAEIAHRQEIDHRMGGATRPKGESCIAGACLAECVRDLDEYRSLWAREQDK